MSVNQISPKTNHNHSRNALYKYFQKCLKIRFTAINIKNTSNLEQPCSTTQIQYQRNILMTNYHRISKCNKPCINPHVQSNYNIRKVRFGEGNNETNV